MNKTTNNNGLKHKHQLNQPIQFNSMFNCDIEYELIGKKERMRCVDI